MAAIVLIGWARAISSNCPSCLTVVTGGRPDPGFDLRFTSSVSTSLLCQKTTVDGLQLIAPAICRIDNPWWVNAASAPFYLSDSWLPSLLGNILYWHNTKLKIFISARLVVRATHSMIITIIQRIHEWVRFPVISTCFNPCKTSWYSQ